MSWTSNNITLKQTKEKEKKKNKVAGVRYNFDIKWHAFLT
jgi:hypothetical protein